MQGLKLLLVLSCTVTALAQSNTCSQKKRVYPTLNVTNESDPKATINGEIWAYGDGTMLACEGPGETFTWLRWSYGKLKEIETDHWAARDNGFVKLKIHPGIIDETSHKEHTKGYQHSGFVMCLAWENTAENLHISTVVPTRYPYCVIQGGSHYYQYSEQGTCCHSCFRDVCAPRELLGDSDVTWYTNDNMKDEHPGGLDFCHNQQAFPEEYITTLRCRLKEGSKLYQNPVPPRHNPFYSMYPQAEPEGCENKSTGSYIPTMPVPEITYEECSITLELEVSVLHKKNLHLADHHQEGHWYYPEGGQLLHQHGGSLSLDAQKKSSDRTQVLYCLETGEESLNCVRVKVTFVQSSYKFTTSMVTVVTDEMTTEKLDAATDIGSLSTVAIAVVGLMGVFLVVGTAIICKAKSGSNRVKVEVEPREVLKTPATTKGRPSGAKRRRSKSRSRSRSSAHRTPGQPEKTEKTGKSRRRRKRGASGEGTKVSTP